MFNSMRREYSVQSAYASKSAMISKQPSAGRIHTFMTRVQKITIQEDQNLLRTAQQTLQLLQKLNWRKVTLQELAFHSFKV